MNCSILGDFILYFEIVYFYKKYNNKHKKINVINLDKNYPINLVCPSQILLFITKIN